MQKLKIPRVEINIKSGFRAFFEKLEKRFSTYYFAYLRFKKKLPNSLLRFIS